MTTHAYMAWCHSILLTTFSVLPIPIMAVSSRDYPCSWWPMYMAFHCQLPCVSGGQQCAVQFHLSFNTLCFQKCLKTDLSCSFPSCFQFQQFHTSRGSVVWVKLRMRHKIWALTEMHI